MKIGDFPVVESLVDTRSHLLAQRDHGRIVIEIDGKRMDAGFVDTVAPGIRLELGRRMHEAEEQLRQLGVTFD